MIERICKRYISCPVCGRLLIKCKGSCDIEVSCTKCNRDIVIISDIEKVVVLEDRRGHAGNKGNGCVRVSMPVKCHTA